jgi:hypothetical protein
MNPEKSKEVVFMKIKAFQAGLLLLLIFCSLAVWAQDPAAKKAGAEDGAALLQEISRMEGHTHASLHPGPGADAGPHQ